MRLRSAGILILALLSPAAIAQGPPAMPVVVDKARLEAVEQWREVTGELRAVRRALLAAEEDGLVVEVLHVEGEPVKAGEPVARLRDTRARLDVARAEAEAAVKRAIVAERTADAEKARRDVARMDELQLRATAAQAESEDKRTARVAAEARLEEARADQAAAEAALNWAKERLARMTIASPFDGRVIAKRTEVGQWLKQGDPVVEVLALDQIDARLDVPERFIDRLAQSGLPVQVKVVATGEIVRAPLSAIIPDADPLSRLFPVRIRLENPESHLRPGMSVVGLVPTGSSQPTLTVSKDALLRNDAGEYVMYNAGGMAAAASVRSLFPVGDRMAIQAPTLPGGGAGVEVIIKGNERLMPGMPIAPSPAQAAPPKP